MKRLLAASLVILAGLFLSPQPQAFFGTGDTPGFYRAGADIPTLDLDFRISFDSRIAFTRASTATCFNSGGILVTFVSGAERLPCYTFDGATWVNRGLLIEEQRINVALRAEELGTTWTNPGGNTTITDNAGVAVDGNTTAEDVLHGDSAETVQQTITAVDNTVYTICANVKQGSTGSHDFVKIAWLDESAGANGFEAWYDISDGTVGTAQADGTGSYTSGSAAITDLSGGWYRVCATGQIVSGQTDARFEIINTTADAVDTAEATNSVFWWGLSAEIGGFGTSYSKTEGSTVTRATDVATMSDVSWLNESAGTIYARVMPITIAPSVQAIFIVDDGGATDRIRFNTEGADGVIRTVNSAGNNGASIVGTIAANVSAQVIGVYAQDDVVVGVDGTLATPDTSADLPLADTLTTLRIGTNHNSANQYNGYLARITYWDRDLADGRLIDRTAFLDWWKGLMYAANDDEPFDMIGIAA